jgi:uncharacterized membrane protein YjdF
LLCGVASPIPAPRLSYTFIFIFLCVHEVGAHYTYAEVPYDHWIKALTGHSLNQVMGWQRNQFDRFAYFLWPSHGISVARIFSARRRPARLLGLLSATRFYLVNIRDVRAL